MLTFHRLARVAGYVWLALVLVATLAARTRKGDKLLAQSRAAEIRKDWDKAISFAEQALSEDPGGDRLSAYGVAAALLCRPVPR